MSYITKKNNKKKNKLHRDTKKLHKTLITKKYEYIKKTDYIINRMIRRK